ncbi:MAG: PKD domain-containing protein [Patescibacteria group bacterium]
MSYTWEIQSNFFESNGIWKSTDNLKIIITETTPSGGQAGQDASDSYFNVAPAPVPVKKCADCGNGVFNLCDKNECLAIDQHCLFSSYIGGGRCSSGGCATDQECATTMGWCKGDYIAKCDTQKRSCSCVPVITEQKISFKVGVNEGNTQLVGVGEGGGNVSVKTVLGPAIPQATVKIFDSQSKQVGSCLTDQNGSCSTNELIPLGYNTEAFPMKSYSTQVSAPGFFANSTVNFDAVLNMDPVQIALYKNTQTLFKATIDSGNLWGFHVGIVKKGGSATLPLQECFAINPPQKCVFSLKNGSYRAFIIDYQFCGDEVGGCFTDFEINNGDIVVKLVAKMTKVVGSPSPYCSRTDGGDEYTKGAVRYITSIATGGFNSIIDHCVANTNFAYISSLEGGSVAQYDCNGWPKSTACPDGCYDGACLIDCPNMSSTFGGFCATEDTLNTVCGQADKVSHQFLGDSFCNKQGGNYCVFCAKPCQTKNDCGYLTTCPSNETKITEPACGTDKKCFCQNLTCSQDSECLKTITCQTNQTPICELKDIYGTTIKPKECFCLNNTLQKRILVHVDDNYTSEDLPGVLVSILDKGSQVASCVTSDPRGKCTISALTFSPEHSYTAVVRGATGYKDAEIKLVSRSNGDAVSANFHLLSSDKDVVTCKQNKECASFPCSGGKNPTCYKQQCECQGGSVLPYACSSDSDCTPMCASGQKQICGSNGQCKCPTATCLDCGNGLLNVCDEKECLAFGSDCVFTKGFLSVFGNNCFNKAQCEFQCSGNKKVCGSDGIVYANECLAQCNKKTFVPGDCSITIIPPPLTTPNISDPKQGTSCAIADWYNADVDITFECDSGADCAKTYWCSGTAGCSPTRTGPLTLTQDGLYYINFYSENRDGIKEAVQSQLVRIDKTGPVVSAPAGAPADWTTANQTAAFTACQDALSGCNPSSYGLWIRPNDESERPAAYGLSLLVDTDSDVYGFASDMAGNTALSWPVHFKIDKTAPWAQIDAPPAHSWQNKSFMVAPWDSDSGSGIDPTQCRYSVFDAIKTRACNTDFNVTVGSQSECASQGQDACLISITNKDKVGFSSVKEDGVNVVAYSIDYTAPSVGKISPATAAIYNQQSFTAPVSDNIAVAWCSLYIDGVNKGAMALSSPSSCQNCSAVKTYTFSTIGSYQMYALCGDLASNIVLGEAVTVNVKTSSNNSPSAVSLKIEPGDYCVFPLRPIFSWTFQDIFDSQSAYRVVVDDTADFSSPAIDTGKVLSPSASYAHNSSRDLVYNKTYFWRVMVWDSENEASQWFSGQAFVTPKHAYPYVDFVWSPIRPLIGQAIQFSDKTVYSAPASAWQWSFGDDTMSLAQNPKHSYSKPNLYSVLLIVYDADNYSCSIMKSGDDGLRIFLNLPEWQEIPPF